MHARVASEAVPTKEVVTQAVIRYVELVAAGRADDVVPLYSEDVTVEDPIGSDLLRGHNTIRQDHRDAGVLVARRRSRRVEDHAFVGFAGRAQRLLRKCC
jgi:ketosteroid isomerase-like protein